MARCASTSPARFACSPRDSVRSSGSVQATPARVRAASSSTSCANTPRLERKTESRGVPAVPRILARTRLRRRNLRWGLVSTVTTASSGSFADLAADVLAHVPDPLALVGLGRPGAANSSCDLAHQLLVDSPDHDLRRRRHLELDPLRGGHRDGMRVADAEFERVARKARPVPDAVDLEPLLVPVGDTLDHVGDQAARQPVEGAVLAAVGGALDGQRPVRLRHFHLRAHRLAQLALRPLHRHQAGLDLYGDAFGYLD